MVRQAKWLMVIAALGTMTFVAGCQSKDTAGEPPISLGMAPGETISYDETAGGGYSDAAVGVSTPGSSYNPPATSGYDSTTYTPADPATSGRPATYTVAKNDTLFSIARKFYNDQTKWRAIYEANRDQLSDPNKVKAGQTLRLP